MVLGRLSLDLEIILSLQVGVIQKFHADGFFECYKGCLVAQEFNQCPGFEYLKVFAPTVCLPTLCIILALAALHDLHL